LRPGLFVLGSSLANIIAKPGCNNSLTRTFPGQCSRGNAYSKGFEFVLLRFTLYPNKATEPLIFHNRLLISIIYLRLTY
jgi:hypothetical protein